MTPFQNLQKLSVQGLFLAFVLVTGTTDFMFLNFSAAVAETPETTRHADVAKPHNEIRLSPSATGKRTAPFGVFDVQSGHGHGQWRDKPADMLR